MIGPGSKGPAYGTGGLAKARSGKTGRLPLRAVGHIEITERDLEILTWVTRHGLVTVEQIAKKFFPTSFWALGSLPAGTEALYSKPAPPPS